MLTLVRRRWYHSPQMRVHQSVLTRLNNVFEPISSDFGDSPMESSASGSYRQKRLEEKFVKPPSFLKLYLEEESLGSPRTSGEFRSLVATSRSVRKNTPRFLDQLRPKSVHVASVMSGDLPLGLFPEIAVVGRSNCGKSSLINALVGRRCAYTEDKPGSTEKLHFYNIGDPARLTFVDVPGFGFAYVSAEQRTEWTDFSLWYLKTRKNLRCVLVVVDARHGLTESDRELVSFLRSNRLKHRIVLNKCDLVERGDIARRLVVAATDLQIAQNKILDNFFPVSALRNLGLDKVRYLCETEKLTRSIRTASGEETNVSDLLEARRKKLLSKQPPDPSETKNPFNPILLEKKIPEKHTPRRNSTNSSPISLDPRAYQPEPNSILKRSSDSEGDITLLSPSQFVSDDELRHLQLRPNRSDTPASNEVLTMKSKFQAEWKFKLELDEEQKQESKTVRKTPSAPAVSSLDFISTQEPMSAVPRGTAKWKVIGMKPDIKTPKKRTAKQLSLTQDTSAKSRPANSSKPRWGNSFTAKARLDKNSSTQT